ncbi:MAG: branched-chain amino acid aminotransferase [Candidatus Heimdallarchaeaceae archaeon]
MNKHYEFIIERCPPEQKKPIPTCVTEIAFGRTFTDHMFLMEYKNNTWNEPKIIPYQPFTLDPASAVFHYGQEIFEGMKAFYSQNGNINLFRPYENAKRFNRSAERMCMPTVDEELFVTAIKELVRLDSAWVPKEKGTSLYIRPTMIATEPALGLHASQEYYFYIILSPVGPYFKTGFNPTKIYVAQDHIRAAPGGTGEAKTGGNYAGTLYETKIAKAKGYNQVLWLDSTERRFVEEVGTNNIAFVVNDAIYTPELDGTILHGITRKSVIQLAKDLGYEVHEQRIDINEFLQKIENGECSEVFGMGTAASIAPVGELYYNGKTYVVNDFHIGPITKQLYDELVGIQMGEKPDRYGWIEKVI